MPFPSSFIAELKSRNPIETVISRYVDLKRAGSNLVGLCPFHSERTPSFTVFSDNFHCFGCSAGGDVITFIMKIENLEYRDAIQFLADKCGMAVPAQDYKDYGKPKSALTREKCFEMNKIAARVFYSNLNSPDGEPARRYLDERKISPATRIHFGLGYALNSFDHLTDILISKGFTPQEINENFLCGISKKNGKPFDMFRNRIIFPIIDVSGNIVAFGGRVLDDSKPKYLNSSDTVVFKKSRNLFALNFAKNVITGDKPDEKNLTKSYAKPGEMILCEGYMDVISMHQAGFGNAVATLGTAITSEHARIISRFAKTVYLAYDSDDAGQAATKRAIRMLTEVGIDAKVIKISGAKDPDEYIKKFGSASFANIISASEGQIDYKLNEILGKYDMNVSEQKYKAMTEACGIIADIRTDLKREIYVERLSQLTGIKQETIYSEIKRTVRNENKKFKHQFSELLPKNIMRYDDRINTEAASNYNAAAVERRIIGILLLYPELLNSKIKISEDDFVTTFNKNVFSNIKKIYETGETDITQLNEVYTPDEFSYIMEMKFERMPLSSNGEDALKEQAELLKKLKADASDKDETDLLSVIEKIKKEKLKKQQ